MTRPMKLKIRPRDEIQEHDWYLYDERDGDGLVPAVQADSLLQAGEGTRIVAACIQRDEPVYLMDQDARLYFHAGSDDILNQYCPVDEFLGWKSSRALALTSPTPSREYWPPFPDGWRYRRCYGDAYILIADEIAWGFDSAVTAGGYVYDYHVRIGFPRVIEKGLIFSGK